MKKYLNTHGQTFEVIKTQADKIFEYETIEEFLEKYKGQANSIVKRFAPTHLKINGYYSFQNVLSRKVVGKKFHKEINKEVDVCETKTEKVLIYLSNGRTHKIKNENGKVSEIEINPTPRKKLNTKNLNTKSLDLQKDFADKCRKLFDDYSDHLGYLFVRWQDEKDYEDFSDYQNAIIKYVNKFDSSLTVNKVSKRPFGFEVISNEKINLIAVFKVTSRDITLRFKRGN